MYKNVHIKIWKEFCKKNNFSGKIKIKCSKVGQVFYYFFPFNPTNAHICTLMNLVDLPQIIGLKKVSRIYNLKGRVDNRKIHTKFQRFPTL
jgi:hypothetical protein